MEKATRDGHPNALAVHRAVDLFIKHLPKPKNRDKTCFSESSRDPREVGFAIQYLAAFGHTAKPLTIGTELPVVTSAIKHFQGFAGLTVNGKLCAKTIRAMEAPRCGCPDAPRPHLKAYKKLIAWTESMMPAWRRRALTYAVAEHLPDLADADQERIFAAAFDSWTRLGNIEVARVDDVAQADIVLATGEGPRSNFDGPGGTLAWALLPDGSDQQLQMRFDLAETWTLSPVERGVALLNVASHEFGHLFGLDHSAAQSALMAPFYNAAVAAPQTVDDVPRFQTRYGVRTQPTPERKDVRIAIEGPAQVWIDNKHVT